MNPLPWLGGALLLAVVACVRAPLPPPPEPAPTGPWSKRLTVACGAPGDVVAPVGSSGSRVVRVGHPVRQARWEPLTVEGPLPEISVAPSELDGGSVIVTVRCGSARANVSLVVKAE